MGSQVHTIHELAIKIFDSIYDDEDLVELERKKVIMQPEGFKLSTVATMECELEDYIDRLVEENKRLRDMLERLVSHDNCRKDVIHLMSEAGSLLSELDGE